MTSSFTLKDNQTNEEYNFAMVKSDKGTDAIDFSNLTKLTGYFSYDPGLKSTAVCKSSICYIDGKSGILEYRGNDINNLVQSYDYTDVAHLLMYSQFPNKNEKDRIQRTIKEEQENLYYLDQILNTLNPNYSPIDNLKTLFSIYIAHNKKETDDKLISKTLGAIPALIYMAYARKSLVTLGDGSKNIFLLNYFDDKQLNINLIENFEKFLILHAEHEQNASTSAVRIIGAAGNSPLNSILSGILALEGTRHGGANEAVVKMLEQIDSYHDLKELINDAKNRKIKIPGLGHRVYNTTDPRAIILKKICQDMDIKNPLLEKALEL